MNNYSVYMHIFPNNKVYVGLTKQDVSMRWQNGNGYKTQYVHNAIKEYGWDNIKHIIIADNLTEQEASEMEQILIKRYDAMNNGYNKTQGGETLGGIPDYYEYKDKQYTVYELAEMNGTGITPHGIQTRINRGWNIEDVVDKPLINNTENVRTIDGKTYSYDELLMCSNVKGLTKDNLINRLSRGWSIERALTQSKETKLQPKGIGERVYEYNGELYNSYELTQISPIDDLTISDITTRINKHGWSVERAITQPKRKRNLLFNYNGETYSSHELANICKDNTMTCRDVTDRFRNGWSVDDIINIPKGISRKKYHNN